MFSTSSHIAIARCRELDYRASSSRSLARRPPDGHAGLVDDRTGSPAALAAALASTGYLADDDLATAAFLALKMHRPLFCEGEPGTGKTALAQALATVLDAELIRLQCYEGIDASQALYDWDFPRQLLHLRALEATGGAGSTDDVEASLYDRRFLLARPILRALQTPARRAARRRDRPRGRRVRGVPARGAHRARRVDPRAGRGARRRPAGRRAHLEPHPRGARRAQAPVPLPVAGPPGRRPGDRDPARADPRAARAAGRRGRRRRPPAARGGPAQAPRRRGVARLGAGPAARRRPPPRHRQRRGDAGGRAQVPRGRRPRPRPARHPAGRPDVPTDRTRSRPRAGPRRVHGRAAPRRPAGHHRAGRRRSSPPSTPWAPGASRSTAPACTPCAPTPTTCRATSARSSTGSTATRGPRRRAATPPGPRRGCPRCSPARPSGDSDGRRQRPAGAGHRLGRRGAAPPRPRRAVAHRARAPARPARAAASRARRPGRRGAGPPPAAVPPTPGARCARRCAPTASCACWPAATGRGGRARSCC